VARARRSDGSAVRRTPSEPLLPPKRREEYVRKLAAALEKGTPERHAIERALAEEPALTSLTR